MNKVMLVTNCLTGGGAERSMNLLSNELVSRGLTISLVPINRSGKDLVMPICEVFPLFRNPELRNLQTIRAYLKFVYTVYRWKPKIIVLNCDLPELFGAFLPRFQKIIVVEHANPPWSNRTNLGKFVRKILTLRGVSFIAVSPHLSIWPKGTEPKYICENLITPNSCPPKRTSKYSSLSKIVFMGRLTNFQKRPFQILDIASALNISALFIGDGPEKIALTDDAQSREINVSFSGYVTDPWSLVSQNDLLVVPSRFEGDGLVVVEAMQRNMPILLADIPDFRRFKLPDVHYCASIDNYVRTIEIYRENLFALVIPDEASRNIIESRSPRKVGDAWESLFKGIGGF